MAGWKSRFFWGTIKQVGLAGVIFAAGFLYFGKNSQNIQAPEQAPVVLRAVTPNLKTAAEGVPFGYPESTYPVTILHNTGFSNGYSIGDLCPLWTTYTVLQRSPAAHTWPDIELHHDDRIIESPNPYWLNDSGFFPTPMAPCRIVGEFFGEKAREEAFVTTNICPESGVFQREWTHWEEIIHAWPSKYGTLWVTCGPIILSTPKRVNKASIPEGYFLIVLRLEGGTPYVTCLLILANGPDRMPQIHVSSINEISSLTGIRFFPQLQDNTKLFSEAAPPWN